MRACAHTLLVVALLLNCSWGQLKGLWWGLPPVARDDPIRPVLDEWQADVAERYERDKSSRPEFSDWHAIQSDELRGLFPEYRFAVIAWSEREHPEAKSRYIARVVLVHATLAIDSTTGAARLFSPNGGREEFGQFLAEHSVRIVTEADAAKVWAAYCDVHQSCGPGETVRVDEFTWHLGVWEKDGYRYHYEVKLDSGQLVTGGQLRAEKKSEP